MKASKWLFFDLKGSDAVRDFFKLKKGKNSLRNISLASMHSLQNYLRGIFLSSNFSNINKSIDY